MHMHMRHHHEPEPEPEPEPGNDPDVGPPPRPAAYLPGYHAQLHEDAVQHSTDKLRESKDDLQLTSWPAGARLENIDHIQTHPCLALEETLAYQCHERRRTSEAVGLVEISHCKHGHTKYHAPRVG